MDQEMISRLRNDVDHAIIESKYLSPDAAIPILRLAGVLNEVLNVLESKSLV